MNEQLVLTKVVGDGTLRTGLITLNRPQQMNALNDALMDQLGDALLAFDADDGIGCIVDVDPVPTFRAELGGVPEVRSARRTIRRHYTSPVVPARNLQRASVEHGQTYPRAEDKRRMSWAALPTHSLRRSSG